MAENLEDCQGTEQAEPRYPETERLLEYRPGGEQAQPPRPRIDWVLSDQSEVAPEGYCPQIPKTVWMLLDQSGVASLQRHRPQLAKQQACS